MRRFLIAGRVLCVFGFLVFSSCKKEEADAGIPDQSFTEEFDTLQSAINRGWQVINRSQQAASATWKQGASFPAYSSRGAFNGCISADYRSTTAGAVIISNWAVSPVVTLQNGDKIIFYSRVGLVPSGFGNDSTDYANRLQVRISTQGQSTNVGSASSAGDFTVLLLDINKNYEEYHTHPFLYSPTAYPPAWTRFETTLRNLTGPTEGRFAFRYFVEQGGNNGRGTEVAVDRVSYVGQAN